MTKNKKGDIPTILLFIETIILIIVALIAFAFFNNKFENSSTEFTEIIEEINFLEQYCTSNIKLIAQISSQSPNEQEIKQKIISEANEKTFILEGAEPCIAKLRRGEFTIQDNILTVQDVTLQSKKGASTVKRTKDFSVQIPYETAF